MATWGGGGYGGRCARTADHRIPIPATHMEPNPRHETQGSDAAQAINTPVIIHVHSRRKQLTDVDGVCAKYVIDALVAAGILPDDSPAHVKEIRYSQEKASVEQTIVTLISDQARLCVPGG